MYVSNKASDDRLCMHQLVWLLADRLCNKYQDEWAGTNICGRQILEMLAFCERKLYFWVNLILSSHDYVFYFWVNLIFSSHDEVLYFWVNLIFSNHDEVLLKHLIMTWED